MKNIALALIAIIGIYTFLRNNIGLLPDQVMWISSPNIFYKTFLPLLMFSGAVTALIKNKKVNILLLPFIAMSIDAVNRLASTVNYYYKYFTYSPPPKIYPTAGVTIVRVNLIPSIIVLVVEILIIIYIFRYAFDINKLNVKAGS